VISLNLEITDDEMKRAHRGRGGCSQGFGIAPKILECSQGFGVKCENLSDLL